MNDVTSLQQARAIIKEVGEEYQGKVIDDLISLTYYKSSYEPEKTAQQVIANIEKEYSLNIANVLYKDKFDELPEYLQEKWSD